MRVADEALAVHGEPADVLRARERGGDRLLVARVVLEREIAGNVVVELRRARRTASSKQVDRGEIAVLDLDQLARVFGDRRGVRDDHRDRLADVAHAAHREHRVVRLHASAARSCPG